jgi:hypothetical protein
LTSFAGRWNLFLTAKFSCTEIAHPSGGSGSGSGSAWGWTRSRQGNREFAANNKVKDAFIMAISTILLIIVILLLLGAVPAWPHSRSWGYGPSGVLGVILIILLILLLLGRI